MIMDTTRVQETSTLHTTLHTSTPITITTMDTGFTICLHTG